MAQCRVSLFPLTNCLMPLAERLGRTKVLKMADAFSQNLGMSENNETTHINGLAAVIGEPLFSAEDVGRFRNI